MQSQRLQTTALIMEKWTCRSRWSHSALPSPVPPLHSWMGG